VNPNVRNALLVNAAVLVLACGGFTTAVVLGVGAPRVLAMLFVLVAVTVGVTLFRTLKRIGPNQELSSFPAVNLKDQRGVKRQISFCNIFIGFLLTLLVFGWLQLLHGAPIFPLIVGTLFNLGLIAGLVLRIKQLRERLNQETSSGYFDT
jgi:hypothetical protein